MRYAKVFMSVLLIASFIETGVSAKKSEAVTPSELKYGNKIIIGQKELAYLPNYDLTMEARIDTGATTTSVDARDIKIIDIDGKKWVKFKLYDRKNKKFHEVKKPLIKKVSIKRHGQEDQIRPAVYFRINISNISSYILVTLTDRSKYEFPVLIGRNFLKGVAIVDVDKSFTRKPTKKSK